MWKGMMCTVGRRLKHDPPVDVRANGNAELIVGRRKSRGAVHRERMRVDSVVRRGERWSRHFGVVVSKFERSEIQAISQCYMLSHCMLRCRGLPLLSARGVRKLIMDFAFPALKLVR
jgi:hypothetical protein